jgi:rubrerythrin
LNAGFKEVYNMDGGIDAWNGLVAEGTPEAGMAYFSLADKPEELIALAWIMEDGSRRFYYSISEFMKDNESSALFKDLTTAEDHHKQSLMKLYSEITDVESNDTPESSLSGEIDTNIMEGGMKVTEALDWAKEKEPTDILELAMSLEISAYDLYLLLENNMEDEKSKKVFKVLAEEEKQHLDRLTKVLENKIK